MELLKPSGLRAIINPAGGLRYHARAIRYRRQTWMPFIRGIHEFLMGWKPTRNELAIVGSSAGWCLPSSFLGRFERIRIVEPDPLARALFFWRFRGLPGHLEVAPAVSWLQGGKTFSPTAYCRLLQSLGGAAILFSNLLGQLACLSPDAADDPGFLDWKLGLAQALTGRDWASFHDRLSGPLAPDLAALSRIDSTAALSDEELVSRAYAGASQRSPEGALEIELHSHRSEAWFPGARRSYLSWELTPGWFHLIEASHS